MEASWKCGPGNKVKVCYNSNNTLCVAQAAVSAHLGHGDYCGPCNEANCISISKKSDDDNGVAENKDVDYKDADNEDFNSGENNFILYPNPTQNILFVKMLAQSHAPVQIEILNSMGQELSKHEYVFDHDKDMTTKLSTSGYASGVYFILATVDGNKIVKSFTV